MATDTDASDREQSKSYQLPSISDSASALEPRRQSARTATNSSWRSLFIFTSKAHAWALVTALLLSIASGLISPAFAILLGKIFDRFTDFGSGKLVAGALRLQITHLSAYLASLGLASWILNGCFFISWLAFGEVQAKVAHEHIFKSLSIKPCAWYDTRANGVASLVPRTQTQIRELQLATSQPLGYVAQHTITSIASLAIAFYYCWSLTLVIMATVPVTAVILVWISQKMQPSIVAQQEHLSVATKSNLTAVVNVETVKCYNGQSFEVSKYIQRIASAAIHYLAQAKANALQIGFVRFITLVMFVQGFWYGHHLVATGSKTTGTVITTFWSCLTATQAVEQVLPHMMVLEKGRAAGSAFLGLLRQDPSLVKSHITDNLPTCNGNVELHNVSFAYPARPTAIVLNSFTGKFRAGRTTFLIGKSGSGKSTVAQLLLRFYSAAEGTIVLDGRPLQTIDPHWLRQNVTLVEQQSVLFGGSIRDNISMGSGEKELTIDDVKKAAQFALLQHTINDLSNGFDTIVQAKGSSLSGGQRQRMALARAWLRNAPILILDEPTSALDQVSRSLIMTAIRLWRKGRTTIIVSHDLSQIQDDDYVYVLKDGRIIKQGSGETLKCTNRSELAQSSGVQAHSQPVANAAHFGGQVEANQSRQRSLPTSHHTRPPLGHVYSDPYDNIINDYLESPKPNPRKSYIPSVFGGFGATPGTGTGFALNMKPRSALQISRPSQRRPTTSRQRSDKTIVDREAQNLRSSPPARRTSRRLSQDMMQLVEMTGKHAMEARPQTMQRRRRSVLSHRPSQQASDSDRGDADSAEDTSLSMRSILSTVWPNLSKKVRILLIAGFVGAIVHAITTPLFSWVFSRLLSTFFDPVTGAQKATKWSLSIIGIAVTDAVACFFMHVLLEFCGQSWVDSLRRKAITRILDQPRQWFTEESNNASGLVQSLDRDAEEMRNLLGRFAAFLLVAIVMMFMAIIWSLAVCWKLTLVGLSIGPVSFAITRAFQAISARMESRCNEASGHTASIMNEAVTNIKTVRALTLEYHFSTRHSAAAIAALRIGLRRALYCGLFFGLSEALVVFTNALIFYYGAVLAASRAYSIEQILLVFSMLLFSMANLSAIVAFIPQIQSSKDTAARLLHLANLPRTSHEHEGSAQLPNDEIGDIKTTNLTFTYPSPSNSSPGKHAIRTLTDVNLHIRAGQCTALVGPSGSGKSTIASLLLRLYVATPSPARKDKSAPITLNNIPLNAVSTPRLRSLMTLVPQTTVLFPSTISANITYGLTLSSSYTTTDAIQNAARSAGIHDFIASLPHGYDTLIGDGGVGLSGGQAQRIGIARALVRRPRCLVLDECTSALDQEGAALVRETVRDLVRGGKGGKGKGMTVIMITHDEAMMEVADHVVMLDRGRVVEEGAFEVLKGKRGGKLAGLLSGGVWVGDGEAETSHEDAWDHGDDEFDDDAPYDDDGYDDDGYDEAWDRDEDAFEDIELAAQPRFSMPGWER